MNDRNVTFRRVRGRVVPIRKKKTSDLDSDSVALVATGAGVAGASALKPGIKARGFKGNVYRGPGVKLITVSDKRRYMPRAFALTTDTGVDNKKVLYASTFFQKENRGWGKRLFAAVQFDAIETKKNTISGYVIKNKALRFTQREKSTFTFKGKKVNYNTARALVASGSPVTASTLVNPKNRSYLGMGLNKNISPNRLGVLAGAALAAVGIANIRKEK